MKNIKPSELIRLAIKDLKTVESMPDKYTVDMGEWHLKLQGTYHGTYMNRCYVCLAGSVMAISLKATTQRFPGEFPEVENLLLALNKFRNGQIHMGLNQMEVKLPAGIRDRNVCNYYVNKIRFKNDMLDMADYLESFNL